jgi:GNAT superfamily N-acetyltransferase
MTDPQFIVADIRSHRGELLDLNVEYFSWVFAQIDDFFGVRCADVVGMPAPAYVEAVIDEICDRSPPEGIFYLVKMDGRIAAMGGLRGLNLSLAEVKRIYVRPAFRGFRLGERILRRLLADAQAFGYERVCLDSAPFMKAAHGIYEGAGFTDRLPYESTEVPVEFHGRWRFMERDLAAPT